MRLLAFSGRTAKEILRDPLNLFFGLGFPLVLIGLLSVTIILFLTMPLMLGSILSFVVFLFYPLIIAKRIKNEEQVLETELDGYADYKKKVKYRLIPYIW